MYYINTYLHQHTKKPVVAYKDKYTFTDKMEVKYHIGFNGIKYNNFNYLYTLSYTLFTQFI